MKKSSHKGDCFLNLGCGCDVRPGWDNYDKYPVDSRVKFVDLEQLPLHFKDNSYDYINMSHVFEHVTVNQYSLMCELSRILKPGGTLLISVPVFHQCVEHENQFFTWDYFKNIQSDFYGNLFSDIKVRTIKHKFSDVIWKVKCFFYFILNREVTYELKK